MQKGETIVRKPALLLVVILLGSFIALAVRPEPSLGAPGPKMSFDAFKQMWDVEGRTPEGATKCLLVAVLETVKENNPEGPRMWGLVLPKDQVDGSGKPDSSQRLAISQFERQVKGTSFRGGIAASYLGGTNQNGYKCSYSNGVTVDNTQTRRGDSQVKLFVRSGGKDNPSPVLLKKNAEGYWKVFEYSSLFTGVKPVESKDF